MPPVNPRTRKLKEFVKEINSKYSNNISTVNANDSVELERTNENNFEPTAGPSSNAPGLQKKQHVRSLSDSSSSSHNSVRDYSPASDFDREYKPTSLDNLSSSSSDESIQITVPKKRRCQNTTLNDASTSRLHPTNCSELEIISAIINSSKSSNSSRPSSSPGSSSSSTSSTSSSESSFSSDSNNLDSDKDCLSVKSQMIIETVVKESNKSLTALQQISLEYGNVSSCEDDGNNKNNFEFSNYSYKVHTLDDTHSNSDHHGQIAETITDSRHEEINSASSSLLPDNTYSNLIDFEFAQELNSHLNNPPSLVSIALETLNCTSQRAIPGVVPEIESLNNISNTKTRKRKRGSKKALAKTLRNMGLQYISSSSKHRVIPERKIGNPCNCRCRLKCSLNISEADRAELFKNYWNMGALSRQRDFISKHITEVKPKYQYKKYNNNRKPKHAFYFTVNGEKKRVCKIFFKNTLGINDRPIRTVIDKINSSGIVEPEMRGKHENHGTKVPSELIDAIKNHINSIPRIESHYLRQQTTREFIEGGKTLTDLYKDYVKECQKNQVDFVKIHIYRKVFKEDFNISFFVPKKDRCEDCVAFENANPTEKENMEEKYRLHIKEKEVSREEKSRDKNLIDSNNVVACYDLQAMMQVPKGDVSSFYYKCRLNCLNFTICELKADNTECYFWTEVEGQKGANEIGSCVFKYLQKKSASTSKTLNVIFYSDNCCGQQKNQFVFSMYIYAVKNLPNIHSITHKFMVKGHTQNEGDSVHSTIERQIKKMLRSRPIYVPDQYIDAIREAKKRGNKYNITELSHKEFYDIKKLQEYKFTKDTEGATVKVGEIRILRVEKADLDVKVLYKKSYMEENYKEIKLGKIRRAIPQLVPLYTDKLPLSDKKKQDLRDLVRKNAIPPYYASSFYNHIL